MGGPSAERYEFHAGRPWWETLAEGLADFKHGAVMWPIWLRLGYRDFVRTTRGTLLGPLWSFLGTGLTVLILGYVYGAAFNMDAQTTYPYIAAGLIVWFFISSCVNGGLSVYRNAASVLKERTLPLSLSVFRYVFRLFIEFLLKFVVFAAAALYAKLPIGWTILLVLPGIALLLANGLWVVLLFGPLGARFRDLQQLIGPLMLIAFLASPVLWPHSALGGNTWVVQVNPFAHFLAMVRDPLLGHPAPHLSVVVTLAITAGGWAAALVFHGLIRNRLVFWL